jgi:hypothetical protein
MRYRAFFSPPKISIEESCISDVLKLKMYYEICYLDYYITISMDLEMITFYK